MDMPILGEIRMVGFDFAPGGWAPCDGRLLPISRYNALYSLIGTTFGGDGVNNFALPDMRSRFPMHAGNDHMLGEHGGAESVALVANQIPSHSHVPVGNKAAGAFANPQGNVWAASSNVVQFGPPPNPITSPPGVDLNPGVMKSEGGDQAHNNMPPFLAVAFIISLYGTFPQSY